MEIFMSCFVLSVEFSRLGGGRLWSGCCGVFSASLLLRLLVREGGCELLTGLERSEWIVCTADTVELLVDVTDEVEVARSKLADGRSW